MICKWYNIMKSDWNHFNVFKNNDKTEFFPFLTDYLSLIEIPIDFNIGKIIVHLSSYKENIR